MNELPKAYDPAQVEQRWYRFWLEQRYFHADAQIPKAPFSIAIPPPNVTGSLHLGHALFVTIQDLLIRWRRMGAYNAMWMPGTDHAGIATQMVVERNLKALEGKSRHDLGREKFIERVWEWKEKNGNRIIEQLKVMGASCDWDRERFTMDEGLSKAVREAFVRLYEEGLIYRAQRLINWCPTCRTALSDLEVEHSDTQGSLWHIAYPLPDGSGQLVVATTRPETMLGDTAVAVHPDDPRFSQWIGKEVELPLTGRKIPVIGDAQLVDIEFGTGAVKVTPGHDFNDFEVGQRHKLETINILNLDGTLNDNVPLKYRGMPVAKARKEVVADLEAGGLLVKTEPHQLSLGRCSRSDDVVEPMLSLQWFVKTEPLAKPAIDAVNEGKTKFIPESWTKTYMHWMTNIRDWCISRQLWWGHRIPVWYCGDGHITVSREDVTACGTCGSTAVQQDQDVLDTWFSSSLWPFSTLGWPEMTRELKTFYPTSVMETGYDILFFWVARMMMMGLHFMKKVPFRTVYLHAIVVDEHGDKMSKVKGNVIDPLDVVYGATKEQLLAKAREQLSPPSALANIEKSFPDGIPAAGADALRFTLASLAAQGRNIRLSLQRVEGYRHFANKLWNAARFAMMNLQGFDADRFGDALREGVDTAALTLADRWILSRLQRTSAEVDDALEAFRFNDAAQAIYHFVWDEFCSGYMELVKPILYDDSNEVMAQKRKRAAQGCLAMSLETSCRLLHPFMPFITEEIWQQLPKATGTPGSIMITMYPVSDSSLLDEAAEAQMGLIQDVTGAVRNLRAEYNITGKVDVTVQANEAARAMLSGYESLITSQIKIGELKMMPEGTPPPGTVMNVVGDVQVYVHIAGSIDVPAEQQRIEKDIKKAEKERAGVFGRLNNPSFKDRAPADVVEKTERDLAGLDERLVKLADSLQRLKTL
ncbi:MAG: Valyl-tRNA synthetase [Myxococcales bacterium]|nr:Valyl-tRNA synthetase [Myxococcales bacterium]